MVCGIRGVVIMGDVGVKINFEGVYRKLSPENLKRGKFATANQMLADMNKFVPARDYTLKNSGHVNNTNDEIIWNTPYSRAQFYGNNGKAVFRKYTTPGTGSRWDLKASSLFMKSWTNAFVRGAGL